MVSHDGFHGITDPRALTDAKRMRNQDAVGGVFGCGSDPDFLQTLTVPSSTFKVLYLRQASGVWCLIHNFVGLECRTHVAFVFPASGRQAHQATGSSITSGLGVVKHIIAAFGHGIGRVFLGTWVQCTNQIKSNRFIVGRDAKFFGCAIEEHA